MEAMCFLNVLVRGKNTKTKKGDASGRGLGGTGPSVDFGAANSVLCPPPQVFEFR